MKYADFSLSSVTVPAGRFTTASKTHLCPEVHEDKRQDPWISISTGLNYF